MTETVQLVPGGSGEVHVLTWVNIEASVPTIETPRTFSAAVPEFETTTVFGVESTPTAPTLKARDEALSVTAGAGGAKVGAVTGLQLASMSAPAAAGAE